MEAFYTFTVLAVCFIAITLIIFVSVKDDCRYWGICTFVLGAIFWFSSFVAVNNYVKPHHGATPTYENVAIGEARVDTTYTICQGDTINVKYEIKWND